MILIIISFDYVGSVHSKKKENYEEGDEANKSLDKSEETHI